MIKTSYLRVYQPLSAFSPEERERWLKGSGEQEPSDPTVSRHWLITAALPDRSTRVEAAEGAFFREIDEEVFVCPWRTRLRMLSSLVAFRNSVPDEIAEAFVSEAEARRATQELAQIGEAHPEIRSHMLHANWHVPLRWFAAFEDSERILVEDKDGLRIRYETRLANAKVRLEHALGILDSNWIEDGIIAALRELLEWLDGFPTGGLLELDYGTVAAMFSHEALLEDRSAGEIIACLEALQAGDPVKAGRLFGALSDRWTEARAMEVVN